MAGASHFQSGPVGPEPLTFVSFARAGLAMFRAEMLPKEFNRILQKEWFGRALTAIPPVFLVLVLVFLVRDRVLVRLTAFP